jgi:hypothetical protein
MSPLTRYSQTGRAVHLEGALVAVAGHPESPAGDKKWDAEPPRLSQSR